MRGAHDVDVAGNQVLSHNVLITSQIRLLKSGKSISEEVKKILLNTAVERTVCDQTPNPYQTKNC